MQNIRFFEHSREEVEVGEAAEGVAARGGDGGLGLQVCAQAEHYVMERPVGAELQHDPQLLDL